MPSAGVCLGCSSHVQLWALPVHPISSYVMWGDQIWPKDILNYTYPLFGHCDIHNGKCACDIIFFTLKIAFDVTFFGPIIGVVTNRAREYRYQHQEISRKLLLLLHRRFVSWYYVQTSFPVLMLLLRLLTFEVFNFVINPLRTFYGNKYRGISLNAKQL